MKQSEFLFDFSSCCFFRRAFELFQSSEQECARVVVAMLSVKIMQTIKREKFHSDEKPSSKSFYGFSVRK